METHPEVVVLEEGKASHDTDIDELARAAKVVLKVGAGRLLRDATDVETAARHCSAHAKPSRRAGSVSLFTLWL